MTYEIGTDLGIDHETKIIDNVTLEALDLALKQPVP
jgi:hypothetical protein